MHFLVFVDESKLSVIDTSMVPSTVTDICGCKNNDRMWSLCELL